MQDNAAPWEDMWRTWQSMQADMYKNWMGAWFRTMTGEKGGGEETPDKAWSDALGFYRQWLDYLQEMMGRFGMPTEGVGPDTFMKMFQTADVYSQLYAMWMKMYENYRKVVGEGGEYDFRAMSEMLESWAEEYREIVQKVFVPALPAQLQWIAELYSGDIPLMAGGLLMHLGAPWYDYFRRMTERGLSLERPSPEAGVEAYEGWRQAYEESYGRLLRAPVMGYYREAAEKLSHTMDSLNEFNIILAEFYASLQSAGVKGFEKLQERMAYMQAEGGKEPVSFRELYRLWWQTNEDIYIELFRTEEFSKLLGQLVDKGMQFRADFQAYIEEATKELPFPNRSEMDHLYKTVDRLKREVRSLKKEMGKLEAATGGKEG
jgi:hypothetical protein